MYIKLKTKLFNITLFVIKRKLVESNNVCQQVLINYTLQQLKATITIIFITLSSVCDYSVTLHQFRSCSI